MTNGEYAVGQVAEILALPAEPQALTKQRLLDEFLHNPFLDDDTLGLALRAGISRAETEALLADLCREGLLKDAGQRGYMLDLEAIGPEGLARDLSGAPPAAASAGNIEAIETRAPGVSPALGLILMNANGQAELVDEQAASWLGVSAERLDAATFESLTGIDPGLMLGGSSKLSFAVAEPCPLMATMHTCCLGDEPGVLIVLQEVVPAVAATPVEMVAVQAYLQEELFGRLRDEVVEPVMLIQQFLENPDAKGLGQARAALEQVNQFLEGFLLDGRKGRAS